MVTYEFSNGTGTYSINKSSVDTLSYTSTGASTYELYLGARNYAGTADNYSYSLLSNVRLYERILTTQEKSDIYDHELPTYNAFPTSPVAYYQLDSNSNDDTGTYDGTDTSVSYNDGISAEYNGSTSFTETGYYINTSNDFTVNFWVKMNSSEGTGTFIFLGAGESGNNFLIGVDNGTYYFGVGDGDENSVPHSFSTSTWYMVSLCFSGGNSYYYVNAVVVDRDLYTGAGAISYDMYIGTYNFNGSSLYPADVSISNVQIHEKLISTQELEAIYDAELAEHS